MYLKYSSPILLALLLTACGGSSNNDASESDTGGDNTGDTNTGDTTNTGDDNTNGDNTTDTGSDNSNGNDNGDQTNGSSGDNTNNGSTSGTFTQIGVISLDQYTEEFSNTNEVDVFAGFFSIATPVTNNIIESDLLPSSDVCEVEETSFDDFDVDFPGQNGAQPTFLSAGDVITISSPAGTYAFPDERNRVRPNCLRFGN